MLVNLNSVGRSQYAATHAHNWVFSLWPFPPCSVSTISPVVLFFLQLPLPTYLLCSVHFLILPSSSSFHPFHFMSLPKPYFPFIHPSFPSNIPPLHFPCSWLTGRFTQPVGEHITPPWAGDRSPGVPAVWQCSVMWTQAWAATSSLTPGLLI